LQPQPQLQPQLQPPPPPEPPPPAPPESQPPPRPPAAAARARSAPRRAAPRRRAAAAFVPVVLLALAAAAAAVVLLTSDGDRDGKPSPQNAQNAQRADRGAQPRTEKTKREKTKANETKPQKTKPETTPPEQPAPAAQPAEPAAPQDTQVPTASIDPARGAQLNDQGFAMMQGGDFAGAVPILQQAVAAWPEDSSELQYAYALFNLGKALNRSGRAAEAIPYLEKRLRWQDQRATVQAELDLARRNAQG
jgi:tetratricopeptide (TPR) repeat protein